PGTSTRKLCVVIAVGSVFFEAMPALAQPADLLQLTRTIALPDVRGRIDHLSVDLDSGRLFVAALGNNTVEVVDLRAGRRSARLEHLRAPQGVAYVPDAKRLFVASGGGGTGDAFAGAARAPLGGIKALADAASAGH